jgi:hypothetical protein
MRSNVSLHCQKCLYSPQITLAVSSIYISRMRISLIPKGYLLSLLFSSLSLAAPTCNTPSNRACWTSGFNINTDYEVSTPTTGVTRSVSPSIAPSYLRSHQTSTPSLSLR